MEEFTDVQHFVTLSNEVRLSSQYFGKYGNAWPRESASLGAGWPGAGSGSPFEYIAPAQQIDHSGVPASGLLLPETGVENRLLHPVDHSHGARLRWRKTEQHLGQCRIGFIVYEDVGLADTSHPDLYAFERQFLRIQTQTLVPFLTIDEGFAVHHVYLRLCSGFLSDDFVKNIFVVDNTVLQNLDKCRAGVVVCLDEKWWQTFLIDIDRPGDETGTRSERKESRLQWAVERAIRTRRTCRPWS